DVLALGRPRDVRGDGDGRVRPPPVRGGQRLGLEDVQYGVADAAAVQRGAQVVRVRGRAAPHVDDDGAVEPVEQLGVDEAAGRGGEGEGVDERVARGEMGAGVGQGDDVV